MDTERDSNALTELNIDIAQAIYGYVWMSNDEQHVSCLIDAAVARNITPKWYSGKQYEKVRDAVPDYSDDETIAWELADKVKLFDQGYHLYRELNLLYRGWYWYVRMRDDGDFIGYGETRAEALCRAAVRLAIADK